MKTDTKWLRLTKDQLKAFDLSSYEWEVVLIKEGTTTKPTDKDLHFNAQEYFSEEELSAMPVFQPMNTDTPPQPAHGKPWRVYEYNCNTSVVNAAGDEVAVFDSDKDADCAIECVNKLMLHPDLFAVEVHSKETMDEVRAALDLFGQIFALQKPAPLGGWNWDQLASQSTDALTKLNP